jgi:hypothetical protein
MSDVFNNNNRASPTRVEIAALANVEQQRAVAEVQARMMIARANRRDPVQAIDNVLRQCTRPSLAAVALYHYARGGSEVSGPSIRLAEAIAQCWGNIASGIKEISRGGGYSECVAYAWDLETGYYDERQFQVRHWRDTKQGGYAITDERDIYELIANMGQRRKRAVLLTVIPGDVVEEAVAQCDITLRATADTSTEAIQKILIAFSQFEVTREQIEARIQRRIESIMPAQIIQLKKIWASLRDEMSQPSDWFGANPRNAAQSGAFGVGATDATDGAAAGAQQQKPAQQEQRGETQQRKPRQQRQEPAAEKQDDKDATSTATKQEPAPEQAKQAEEAKPAEEDAASSYWLVNAEGEPLEEKFTDPVAYMTAVANAKADTFPADWPIIQQANSDDLDRAVLASAEAAAIYKRDVLGQAEKKADAAPAQQQEEGQQQASQPAAEEQAEEQEPARDPMFIDPPAKQDAAGFRGYMQQADDMLGKCTSGGMIDHFVSVNQPTYRDFPGKWRTTILAAVKAQRDKLSPPPAQGESRRSPRTLADGLKRDIATCKTTADLSAFDANNAVKSQVQELLASEGGQALYEEVKAFAKEHAAKLKAAASG